MSKDRKKLIAFLIAIIVILVFAIVYLNTDLFKDSEVIESQIADNIRFYREYLSVPQENVFKYVTVEEAIDILKNGTGIIFFGFPSCHACQHYVPVLNEIAMERDVETIYYYNIKEIREKNTEEYIEIVSMIKKYLPKDNEGNEKVFVPDIYFVKSGKIIGHNNELSTIPGNEVASYFNEERRRELKISLTDFIEKLYPETCGDVSIYGC